MKRLALLLLVCFLSNCSNSVSDISGLSGTYQNEGDNSEYIELKEDKTFYLEEAGSTYAGEYEVRTEETTLEGLEIEVEAITFTLPSGRTSKAVLRDGKIYDQDHKVWVRR